jgi:hypothetical protein
MMPDFSVLQLLLIGLLFVWTGFVRTGLGFGGAVLSLSTGMLAVVIISWVLWLGYIRLEKLT